MPKILIIRFSSIGDIVLTSPVIRCLKEQLPGAELHFLTKKAFKPVVENNPYLDKLFYLDKDLAGLLKVLKQEKYDFVVDLHNRASKFSSSKFEAFHSPNYPPLAEAGVHIKLNNHLFYSGSGKFSVNKNLDTKVGLLKIFPGMNADFVECILNSKGLKGLVLETFGSGNAPTDSWFIDSLKAAIDKGLIIYNVTQCSIGTVEQGRYETSVRLKQIGVVSGKDITTEAAITKLMFVLGQQLSHKESCDLLEKSLRGEISNESSEKI